MTREEILEKSRKENKNSDERERQINTNAGERSSAFALLLCILVSIINLYYDGPRSVGAAAALVTTGTYAAREVHLAKKLGTRVHKVLAVLLCLGMVIELVIFIDYTRRGR